MQVIDLSAKKEIIFKGDSFHLLQGICVIQQQGDEPQPVKTLPLVDDTWHPLSSGMFWRICQQGDTLRINDPRLVHVLDSQSYYPSFEPSYLFETLQNLGVNLQTDHCQEELCLRIRRLSKKVYLLEADYPDSGSPDSVQAYRATHFHIPGITVDLYSCNDPAKPVDTYFTREGAICCYVKLFVAYKSLFRRTNLQLRLRYDGKISRGDNHFFQLLEDELNYFLNK